MKKQLMIACPKMIEGFFVTIFWIWEREYDILYIYIYGGLHENVAKL